jgi:hypothetical protein
VVTYYGALPGTCRDVCMMSSNYSNIYPNPEGIPDGHFRLLIAYRWIYRDTSIYRQLVRP